MDSASDALLRTIVGRLSTLPSPKGTASELTVGVEHEFFLTKPNGEPCSHEESQEFLKELSAVAGWHIQELLDFDGREYLNRVSNNIDSKRYTAVKYDHHPHLLEVAFAYQRNIDALYGSISNTFELIETCAEKVGLRPTHKPLLELPPSDPRITSPLPAFTKLRSYRKRLFEHRGESGSSEYVNYAAVIAATQTHVGGLPWWADPRIISHLYSYEPWHLLPSLAEIEQSDKERGRILRKRWEGYAAVFKGFPLIGYPDLKDWSLEAWANALLNSPLAKPEGSDWSLTAKETGLNTFRADWDKFFVAVRDLQIIRPRLFGTLEFRADPALPTPKAIARLVARRLATSILAVERVEPQMKFRAARSAWWSAVSEGTAPLIPVEFEDRLIAALKQRNLGEEHYIIRHSDSSIGAGT